MDDNEPHLDPLTRPPKCLGLALSDAMDIGPYQAGALIGLLKNGQEYEVITGVTMGALNAYILALHEKDEVNETIKELCKSHRSLLIDFRGLLDCDERSISLPNVGWWVHLWLLFLEGSL